MPISEVSEFSIWPYTQNQKLGNLGKFSFTSIFDSIRNSRSKYQKKMTQEEKTLTERCGLIRKKVHFRGFQVFHFTLYLKPRT